MNLADGVGEEVGKLTFRQDRRPDLFEERRLERSRPSGRGMRIHDPDFHTEGLRLRRARRAAIGLVSHRQPAQDPSPIVLKG